MDWISVKDRLPEDTAPDDTKQIKVLTAIKAKNGCTVRSQMRMKRRTSYHPNEEYGWFWRFSQGDVTHWMPLPEPPEA